MMLAAGLTLVALLFESGTVTQFYLTNATNLDYYTGMGSSLEVVNGWGLRGARGLFLPLIVAGFFASPWAKREDWRKWMFWAGTAVLFAAVVPTSVPSLGGLFAWGGVGLAGWTAWKQRKADASGAP